MAKRFVSIPAIEQPTDILAEAIITDADIRRANRKFKRRTAERFPILDQAIDAKAEKTNDNEPIA